MRRRELILAAAGAALALPGGARSEEMARVGVISAGQPRTSPPYVAFDQRMQELGYVDGRNVSILFRNAEGHSERLPQLATAIVGERPHAIVAIGPEATLQAVSAATKSIPIIMVAVDYDPIERGYLTGLARPEGNITGIFARQIELAAKRLEMLTQVIPTAKRIGVLSDEFSADQLGAAQREGSRLGLALEAAEFRNPPYDFEPAMTALRAHSMDAVLTLMSPVFFRQRGALADSLLHASLPASFGLREWAEAGGLMSYGASLGGMLRRAAAYVDKILKGRKPADLSVEQPTNFELVVNLKTANALGLTVPQAILGRADEVIE